MKKSKKKARKNIVYKSGSRSKKTRSVFKRKNSVDHLNNILPTLKGTFSATERGFGFVSVEGYNDDFFIPARDKLNAFNGDIVEIQPMLKSKGKRKEARIISIAQRSEKPIIGLFRKSLKFGFVLPDSSLMNEDIYIPVRAFNGAEDFDKVVIKITDYGNNNKKPEGEVIEVLGNINSKGIDVLSIIKEFEAPTEFNDKVIAQANNVAKPVSKKDIEFRKDLRDWFMVTIDGEDSKDLDDAVSLQIEDDKYILGVHIADVSNYVQEYSALDREALKRGTSIYPVDRVIPMLPPTLSNGICSLNENEDRLALSCVMYLDKDANLVDYDIMETVIKVSNRLNYNQVEKALNKEKTLPEDDRLLPMLKLMKKLSSKLKSKRAKRGAIDFNFKESKIILDENDVAVDIVIKDRNIATSIIEEFMLAANETVARHFENKGIPFVYRVHAKPDDEKLDILQNICRKLGYPIRISKSGVTPKQIANLIKRVKGSDVEMIISRTALRSMQQAIYSVECSGHFGLAADYYCHFTSPIRRYPDLQIHRIIRESLHGKLNSKRLEHYLHILDEVAGRSSYMERRAVEIERKAEKIKKAEYMYHFEGETFTGRISCVMGRGIFVELENTVDGMVALSTLTDDEYVYDEENMSVYGLRKGRIYTVGDVVEVTVARVDKQVGNIDFVFSSKE